MDATQQPLVSIIAISYNHAPYIKEALASVFAQTYQNIELIIADDCSTDNSVSVIKQACIGKNIPLIIHQQNQGNCKTFNEALRIANGAYIVDFALDDLMYPERIAKQVALFERRDQKTGVVFTNVDVIDAAGNFIYRHYPKYHHSLASTAIPEGNVFNALLSRYYINPVSMIVRREVMEYLNGYDEALSYEDFDFWIRSSAIFEYAYLPEILSAKRITPHALSSSFYKKNQELMFVSTLQVCKKAWWLCKDEHGLQALVQRCRYEMKQSMKYGYADISNAYKEILQQTDPYFYLSYYWIRVKALF